jgi:hypothetical protein
MVILVVVLVLAYVAFVAAVAARLRRQTILGSPFARRVGSPMTVVDLREREAAVDVPQPLSLLEEARSKRRGPPRHLKREDTR